MRSQRFNTIHLGKHRGGLLSGGPASGSGGRNITLSELGIKYLPGSASVGRISLLLGQASWLSELGMTFLGDNRLQRPLT
jgi:hypothetical protein